MASRLQVPKLNSLAARPATIYAGSLFSSRTTRHYQSYSINVIYHRGLRTWDLEILHFKIVYFLCAGEHSRGNWCVSLRLPTCLESSSCGTSCVCDCKRIGNTLALLLARLHTSTLRAAETVIQKFSWLSMLGIFMEFTTNKLFLTISSWKDLGRER